MILSLEVLQAKEGDCLILHYGVTNAPKFVVIDGGPSGIYTQYLRPRLLQIKEQFYPEDSLPLAMVMVSHADDDHINGIKMLTNELVQQKSDQESPLFKIDKFWFNGFDDIIGNVEVAGFINTNANILEASATPHQGPDSHTAAMIASTGQGRTIRDNAVTLGLSVNEPFKPLKPGQPKMVRGDTPDSTVNLAPDVTLRVLHPNHQRLIELQKQWDEDLKEAKEKGDKSIIIASLSKPDSSPFNLSSIVCLVEHDDNSILLTGDGRSDDIFKGLKDAGKLDADNKLHVNILKMPHHGSKANMTADFLQKITADHYVISADGKHKNPDREVLDMFEANVKSGILHLTNHSGKLDLQQKLDDFIQRLKNNGSNLKVSFPGAGTESTIINLLGTVTY